MREEQSNRKGGSIGSEYPIGDGMAVHVLGTGSAMPKPNYHPSSHLLQLRDKYYMIDCGEGTQMQMMCFGLSFQRLHRIFLTHLHGDHCLGLPGLLSTMSLLGMEHPVHIYGPTGTEEYVRFIIDHFCHEDDGRLIPHELPATTRGVIYEDRSLTVSAFPLQHRIPALGYRFDEKPKLRHLRRDMADFYQIPVAYFGRIKQGDDWELEDGTIIPNARLTKPARQPYSYAYCSDTCYSEGIIPAVQGVDLLYHEATFMEEMRARAEETMHSTTRDAATIAEKAGVGHLLIGHYSGRYCNRPMRELLVQECQSFFPKCIGAYDGLVLSLEALRKAAEEES